MNKIAFITGATSGIGKACAEKFAAEKYDLIITGRREERLKQLKESIERDFETKVFTCCFDVQDRKTVFTAVDKLPHDWKNVQLLINNAGLALGRAPFDEADIDDWDTMMHTNVDGLLYVSRAILPLMKLTGNGHIINIGSVAGKAVYENGSVYCASKFAVDAISQAMRIDLMKHGIKVTAVDPGAVETEFSLVRYKGDKQKADAAYNGFTPLTPADVANSVYYCASLPAHVCVNDLVLTSIQQAGVHYFHKI